jgi:hypothetical protein
MVGEGLGSAAGVAAMIEVEGKVRGLFARLGRRSRLGMC